MTIWTAFQILHQSIRLISDSSSLHIDLPSWPRPTHNLCHEINVDGLNKYECWALHRAEQQRTHRPTAEMKINAKIGGEKKTMLQRRPMKVGWYRLRGRPRLGWMDRVRSDLKEQQIDPKLAQNRESPR